MFIVICWPLCWIGSSRGFICKLWPGSTLDKLWILEVYCYQVLDPFYRELSPVFRGGSAEFPVEYKLGFELV